MVADMAFEDEFIKPFAFMPAMHLARQVRLIEILRTADGVAAIAVKSGLRPDGTQVLLRILDQAGLVAINNGRYLATDLGRRVLAEGHGHEFLDPAFRFFELVAPFVARLQDRTAAEDHVFPMDWPPSSGSAAQIFESFMTDTAPYVATWLDELFEWSTVTSVLDVGGGDGTIMAMLCARHASLSATIFNLPWAQPLITATVESHRVPDRLTAHCGDFRHDELPTGYDVVLFARMLSDWPDAVVARLLRMARRSLTPGGRIVALESSVPEDAKVRDDPTDVHPWALFWELCVPGFGLHGPRTEPEWRSLAAGAGLVSRQLGRCGRLPFPSLTAIEFVPAEPT